MTKIIPVLLLSLFLAGCHGSSENKMTVNQFRGIVASPGDNVPLAPSFALMRPYWPKTKYVILIKQANGKMVHDEATGISKTIDGKYIVSTMVSKLLNIPVSYVTTYDEKPGTFHVYRLQDKDHLIDATFDNDVAHKSFVGIATYGDGMKERVTGTYTDTQCLQQVQSYKDADLISHLDITITPDTE